MSSLKRFRAVNLPPVLASKICAISGFLYVKSNTWAFLVMYLFQLEF